MSFRSGWRTFAHSTALVSLAMFFPVTCAAQGFPPISPDELKTTNELGAEGAPAILLFREVDRDDNGQPPHEDNYIRIKVLTEQGRRYANIEIEFDKAYEDIVNIRARTIRPDGSIAQFDGNFAEQTIAKAQGLEYLVKAFTLPDVQVGSVIEYSYSVTLNKSFIYSSHWILNYELFTRRARFTLKPYRSKYNPKMSLRRSWQGLPPGAELKEGSDHSFTMDVQNIPAFEVEDYMPPPNEVKGRVDFIYEDFFLERDPDLYWKHVGMVRYNGLEAFLGKRKAMEEAVAQIVLPNDTAEEKLRKIYGRVQKLRNTTYEIGKTAQEEKRDKEKPARTIEDVWKHGYGDAVQLTWLYLGLVRAAGFEAFGVWVSSRRHYFFNPKTMENGQLDANVVLVKLNGKDLYLDPGAAFTPFGMLTWYETGTPGLCLAEDGGTWVKTPLPRSSESSTHQTAKLKLSESGSLEGKVTVSYSGLEAMYNRQDFRNSDEVARKKFLEDRSRNLVPAPAQVELINSPEWNNPEKSLVAEFDVKIPDWASNTGKRWMIPASLFTALQKHIFEHSTRIHPIYFAYPTEQDDEVTIELPAGWKVASIPPAQSQNGLSLTYRAKTDASNGVLHLTRTLNEDIFLLGAQQYAGIRAFYQAVRADDEQQIVLQPAMAAPSN